MTLTELRREPRRALAEIRAGREVTLTEHGTALAEIRATPAPRAGHRRTPLEMLAALGDCPAAERDRQLWKPEAP